MSSLKNEKKKQVITSNNETLSEKPTDKNRAKQSMHLFHDPCRFTNNLYTPTYTSYFNQQKNNNRILMLANHKTKTTHT